MFEIIVREPTQRIGSELFLVLSVGQMPERIPPILLIFLLIVKGEAVVPFLLHIAATPVDSVGIETGALRRHRLWCVRMMDLTWDVGLRGKIRTTDASVVLRWEEDSPRRSPTVFQK